MRSMVNLKRACGLLPCTLVLALVAGCGSGGTTAAATGDGTNGAGGAGAGGGSTTATTGAGMGGGTATASSSTGLGMDGPPLPVGAPIYNMQPNGGTSVAPGSQAGYGITGDGQGTFVIFWTGNTSPGNPAVAFEGSIWTPGHFSSIFLGCSDDSCSLEPGDVIAAPDGSMGGGEHIAFKTTATNDLDGLEFFVDKEPVYFDLMYDGQRQTGRVVYSNADKGGSFGNPQKIPFGITSM